MTTADVQRTSIRVILFGEARIVAADGSVHRLERKNAGVLAYLAFNGAVARARVAALLWPEVDDDNARSNLRQRLSRLRRAAGDLVIDRGGVLALREDVAVDTAAPVAGASMPAPAVLLGTHDYDDCTEFSDWLQNQRDALRQSRSRALLAQAQALRETDPDQALHIAQVLLLLEPQSEEAYRALIELYYLRGDIGSALAAFDKCTQMLGRVYGAAPAADTARLGRLIQTAAGDRNRPANSRAIPASLLRPPRMIGRDAVLALAHAAIAQRHTLLIAGEAGIGKSRLIEELLAQFAGTAIRFRCRPNDALEPRRALARCLIEVERVCAPRLDQATRRQMARLIPALGDAPEPMTSGAEVAALHRAACDFLDACQAATGALLIAFDDLHFADPASIDALQDCLRPAAAARASAPCFVLASRAHGGSWQAKDLMGRLETAPQAQAIVLAPLALADTQRLVADLDLGEPGWTRMADQLQQHCGGNPAILLETLRALVCRANCATTERGLPIPASVAASLQERLAGLSAAAVETAQLAAVAGEEFSLDLAQRVLGQPRIALATALHELEAAQVFRDGTFAHDLLREAVRDGLNALRRQALHLSLAAALHAMHAAPALIAHHLLGGGDPVSALPHLRAAERLAYAAQRPDECGRLLEEIARIELDRGERAGAVAALARSFAMYMSTSFVEDANRVFDRWAPLASTPAEKLALHAQRAGQQAGFQYPDEALRHALLAIEILDASPELEAESKAESFVAACPALILAGRAREAAALAERIAGALAQASPQARLDFLKGQGSARHGIGRHDQAIDCLRQAVALHETGLDPMQEWDTRMRLANYLGHAGRHEEAAAEAQRSIEAGRRQPHFPTATGTAHFTLACALGPLGQFREAITYLEARRDYFRRTGWRSDVRVAARLALLHLQLGALHEAAEGVRELDLSRAGPADRALVDLVRAQIAHALGKDGAPHLAAVASHAAGLASAEPLLRARLLALTALAPATALAEAQRVLAQAREENWPTLIRSAAIAAAGAAVDAGQPDEATAAADLALGYESCCDGIIGYQPDLWWTAARAYRLAGQTDAARRFVLEALAWIDRIAAEQVPAEFRASFLQRNPCNRAVRAAARELAPDPDRPGQPAGQTVAALTSGS